MAYLFTSFGFWLLQSPKHMYTYIYICICFVLRGYSTAQYHYISLNALRRQSLRPPHEDQSASSVQEFEVGEFGLLLDFWAVVFVVIVVSVVVIITIVIVSLIILLSLSFVLGSLSLLISLFLLLFFLVFIPIISISIIIIIIVVIVILIGSITNIIIICDYHY